MGDVAAKTEYRGKVVALEKVMLNITQDSKEPELECPLNHHFAPGMYAREILLPAGSIVIGKIHKHSHINVISQGIVEVASEEGVVRYEAPITFVNDANIKRCVHAITDTIWTTVHLTESTSLEDIEKEVIAESYQVIEEKL